MAVWLWHLLLFLRQTPETGDAQDSVAVGLHSTLPLRPGFAAGLDGHQVSVFTSALTSAPS